MNTREPSQASAELPRDDELEAARADLREAIREFDLVIAKHRPHLAVVED